MSRYLHVPVACLTLIFVTAVAQCQDQPAQSAQLVTVDDLFAE
jgi:hypothetical protein